MIQVSLEVVLADDQRQKFLSILRPLLEPTSCEAGCTRCAVWMNISDERRFRFLTEWQSVADLDRYLESGRFREVLVATELSEEAPHVRSRQSQRRVALSTSLNSWAAIPAWPHRARTQTMGSPTGDRHSIKPRNASDRNRRIKARLSAPLVSGKEVDRESIRTGPVMSSAKEKSSLSRGGVLI